MDYGILEKCALFRGIPAKDIPDILAAFSFQIQNYGKETTIFHLMDPADRIGIILEGQAQAQKTFPNGSQVNVSVRRQGELIGPAAAFSVEGKYPCDVVALTPASVMMFKKEDLLHLLQKDLRIMNNFISQISTATHMLQTRLELFSYSSIAGKAAFWLLMQRRQTGKDQVMIPGSMTKWAMLMNVSRPSLHREVTKLESAGMIRYMPPVIDILDPDALEEVLGR